MCSLHVRMISQYNCHTPSQSFVYTSPTKDHHMLSIATRAGIAVGIVLVIAIAVISSLVLLVVVVIQHRGKKSLERQMPREM